MPAFSPLPRSTPLLSVLVLLIGLPFQACPAEITGTVTVDQKGLFEGGGGGHSHPISVALIPLGEGEVGLRESKTEYIELIGNRMTPSFLTVQQGDKIEFVNRDNVFHELFSLSQQEPLTVRLGRNGSPGEDRAAIRLDQEGVNHFFCRIHNKSYARIDVVRSPYMQTVRAGQRFHFSGLAAGRWQLRLASPAAETQLIEVRAMTAPPELHLTLASHDGGNVNATLKPQSGVEQLYEQKAQ